MKFVFFLFILAIATSQAQISRLWTWEFNSAAVGQANADTVIHQLKSSLSDSCAAEIRLSTGSGDNLVPRGQYLVLLSPNGDTLYQSEDLLDTGINPPAFSSITLLSVGQGTMAASIIDVAAGAQEKILTFNQAASPQVNMTTLPSGEFSAVQLSDFGADLRFETIGPQFSPQSIFTIVSTDEDFATVCKIRRYRVGITPTVAIVASTAGRTDGNLLLQWNTVAGESYRIEKSTNLMAWSPVGNPIVGTGAALTWSSPATGEEEYYRVVAE